MLRKRSNQAAIAAAVVFTIGAGAATAPAAGPLTAFKIADEWGTINPSGPRAGVNGVRFWNAEGADNGNFASTAPFRFNTADLTSQFDAEFGAGQWKVANVNIVFTQSNGSFTRPGGVDLYHFANDSLQITNGVDDGNPGQFSALGVSPLRYSSGTNALDTVLADGTTDASAIFGNFSLVDNYQFTSNGAGGDWPLDVLAPKNPDGTYKLVNPESPDIQIASPNYGISTPIVNPGRPFRSDTQANFDAYTQRVQTNLNLASIAADLESGSDALSFILVADAATAATYKGNPFGGDFPARIYITAEEKSARLAGDVNGDGFVDGDDIDPFIFALDAGTEAGFLATYPNGVYANADIGGDTFIDGDDIDPFISLLDSGGQALFATTIAAVPEPASAGVLGLAAAAVTLRRRRRRIEH